MNHDTRRIPMTVSSTNQLDSLAAALKERAAELADLLKQQAALKAKLDDAANDAVAAGAAYFAGVFRDLGARLGALTAPDSRPTVPVARRRGRPAKAADDESSVS
jgi:hypothetical protein